MLGKEKGVVLAKHNKISALLSCAWPRPNKAADCAQLFDFIEGTLKVLLWDRVLPLFTYQLKGWANRIKDR